MALTITRVEYRDFRNMASRTLEPHPGLTVLVGPNAVGKTNCVEGIALLTSGQSFRHLAGPSDLVREGASSCRVSMLLEGEKRRVDVEFEVVEGKKRLLVNGKARRMGEGARLMPSVLFYPDDLMVIKGPASGRRAMLDDIGVQLSEAYRRVHRDYQRALAQRNALLRVDDPAGEPGADPRPNGMLEAWTEALVGAGATLYLYRRSLLARLTPLIADAYASIAPGERLDVGYESSYAPALDVDVSRADVEAALRVRLGELRVAELSRRVTLAGPHRDDVTFAIDGRPARLFGSQGQQRTISLAEKIAHVNLVRAMTGTYPVVLLDDVMSELDATRRSALFDLIHTGVQTIMTTTNLDYFTPDELGSVRIVDMGHE